MVCWTATKRQNPAAESKREGASRREAKTWIDKIAL
jgi:hypothetical protein